MRIGEGIGYATTPIIMAILYYVVVTPIALMRRLVVKRRRQATDSSWHQRAPLPSRERMERQF
jgi:hypothetical protein